MTDPQSTAGIASRVELMRTEIPGANNHEAVMFLMSLPPGVAAPAHTHPGIGVGYILEGLYESKYEGEALKRFTTGDSIYDLAHTPHLIARNGSQTDPLRFIMTFVVSKGEPTILPLQVYPRVEG